jgi:hypothetical protein
MGVVNRVIDGQRTVEGQVGGRLHQMIEKHGVVRAAAEAIFDDLGIASLNWSRWSIDHRERAAAATTRGSADRARHRRRGNHAHQ